MARTRVFQTLLFAMLAVFLLPVVRAANGPQVTAMSPAPGSSAAAPSSITITFSANIDPASVNNSTCTLVRAGPDGILGTADDVVVVPTSLSVNGSILTMDMSGVQT